MFEEPGQHADYEAKSLERQEYIAAIVHLYRGELYRANSWRMRLDNTTNWSIITTAGLMTFSFDGQGHTHWVLIIGMLLITAFLSFEARRFRFFDVWRYRVRKIEENFYGPILRRDPVSPDAAWGARVAEDLLHPVFKISFRAAFRARFVRNYWVIYAALIGGWILKVMLQPTPVESWSECQAKLGGGVIPWWLPVAIVALLTANLAVVYLFFPRSALSEDSYWSPGEGHHTRDLSDLDR
jgi:uncharacterized membrane protein